MKYKLNGMLCLGLAMILQTSAINAQVVPTDKVDAEQAAQDDAIYDIEIIRHLRKANDKRNELEKEAGTHLEKYKLSTARLTELRSQEDVNPESIPEIDGLYAEIIESLSAVLANEGKVRSLFRSQVDILRLTLGRAKASYLNGGNTIEATGQAAKSAKVLEQRLATYAHKIQNGNLPEHWRVRYESLFQMALENKQIFDTTIGQLSEMEATTRRDAIAKLETLLSSTYEDYLRRLVTYRQMEFTREQYNTSRALLADISTVVELKKTINLLEAGHPKRFDLKDYGPQLGASEVLGQIVQGLVGEEPASKPKKLDKVNRKQLLDHYAKLYAKGPESAKKSKATEQLD